MWRNGRVRISWLALRLAASLVASAMAPWQLSVGVLALVLAAPADAVWDPHLECGFRLKAQKLIPENPLIQPEFYNGHGLDRRDRWRNDLYKLARLLDDAGLLPVGEIWLPPINYGQVPVFRLAETLNVSGKFLREEDVQELRERSPNFRFFEAETEERSPPAKVILQRLDEEGAAAGANPSAGNGVNAVETVIEMDLGPFREYGLINISRNAQPMFQRDYLAFKIEGKSLHAFHVVTGAVERAFSLRRSLFPKWEELYAGSQSVFLRIDKVQPHPQGAFAPIFAVETIRVPTQTLKAKK